MSNQVADTGIVTKIDDNFATIIIDSTDDCKDCGIKFLCSPGADNQKSITLENTIGAKLCDKVVVSEVSNVLLKLSVLQYGVPLIGFILGIMISSQINIKFNPIELYQFICGLVGLVLGGLISYSIIKRMAKKPNKLFRIKKT